jgi:GxxExxY protein
LLISEAAMVFEVLTEKIIACSIEVHKELGPGLLESIYESALTIELFRTGMGYQRQKPLQVAYKGESIGEFRMDLVVEDTVVVELKSTERHDPLFEAQLLSYMKLGNYKIGLLINFNSLLLTKGIKRFVL